MNREVLNDYKNKDEKIKFFHLFYFLKKDFMI